MLLGTWIWTDEEKAVHKKKSKDGGACHSDMDDDEKAAHRELSRHPSNKSDMDDDEKAAHKKKSEDGGSCCADDPREVKLRQTLNGNSKKNDLQQQLQHVYQTNGGKNALEFRKKKCGKNNPAINRKISIVFHTFEDNDDWEEQMAYLMYDSTDEEELSSLERARVTYNGIARLLFPKNIKIERYLFIAGTSDKICDIKIE